MHIGIIRERKSPPDTRVPLTPKQCKHILEHHPDWQITVESSPARCFSDEEYREHGIKVSDDMSDCDVLMGVKEVPIDDFIANKVYFIFSHTIKEQPYNKKLLKTAIAKEIQLVDYECLTDLKGKRIIGFGGYAGIVGAHNGLLGYGKKFELFELKRAKDAKDFDELKSDYKKIDWPNFRTIITGGGRVASGAIEVMKATGIREVSPEEYLEQSFDEAVWCNVSSRDYYRHKKSNEFVKSFYDSPENFNCVFLPYAEKTDLMINGIYYNPDGPPFFAAEDMTEERFRISVIADVTCDIAPEASIPSTLYASTIADPFFDYNPITKKEEVPFQKNNVLMMTIDNLPNELPRDASQFFGDVLIKKVLPELAKAQSALIEGASICKGGALTSFFEHLSDYAS